MTEKEQWERDLNEKVELAKRLPEIGRALEKVVDEVFEMTKGRNGRRGVVMDEIGHALRQAQTDANNGKSLRIGSAMAELGKTFSAQVERARNPPRKPKPLRRDTAIKALRPLRYKDAGNPNEHEVLVDEDAICLIPHVVAEEAKAANAAEILPSPPGRRLQFVRHFQYDAADERHYIFCVGDEKLVAEPIAKAALDAGAAVVMERLLKEEIESYRGSKPNLSGLSWFSKQHGRGRVNLGVFNTEADETPLPSTRTKSKSVASAGAA